MNEPLFSVAMGVYNGANYLHEQVTSILSQSWRNLELVIADDRSTDQSFDLVRAFAEKDSRVRVFRNDRNMGIVPNFLAAVSRVRGDFVAFSDQDDVWDADKLRVLGELLSADTDRMLAYSDLEICGGHLEVTHHSFLATSGVRPRAGNLREKSVLKNVAPGCAMAFRKSVADALARQSYTMPFLHDHMALVLASAFGSVVSTSRRLVKYRQHAANNIGAFYPTVWTRGRLVRELETKIAYLRTLEPDLRVPGLDRLALFLEALKGGRGLSKAEMLEYHLFLRNDTLRDKLLGAADCFFPQVYGRLRARFKPEKEFVDDGFRMHHLS